MRFFFIATQKKYSVSFNHNKVKCLIFYSAKNLVLISFLELHSIMTWIADCKCFLIRHFVFGRIKTWIKTRQCAKPRPLCCFGNHEQIFHHSSVYLDAFPPFPCSPLQQPARILVPVRGTIRDTHPGGKCLRPCWNLCDVGKCRVFSHQGM